MNILHFGVTFWFNIYDDYKNLLENLSQELKDEFTSFNYSAEQNQNLLTPIISAINNEKRTNMHVTRISAQYNMDNVNLENYEEFKDKALKIFNILNSNDANILYSSIIINAEKETNEALNIINDNLINKKALDENVTETDIKLAAIIDEQFYKVIRLTNNKQIKLSKKIDTKNREVPIPLISLNGSFVEKECILIDYELNDRYLYDFTKDYKTTEFHLNKMLYLVKENFKSDIENLIS